MAAGCAATSLNCCVNISVQLAHHKIFSGVMWLAVHGGLEKATPEKGEVDQGVLHQHTGRFLGRVW